MAKIITITNGSGSEQIINGTYQVTAEVNGYDNSSINPSSVVVDAGTNDYAFTIESAGTLTLHVSDDGTSSGNPIVGATFVRTDASGNTYGDPITTDTSGNAVFNHVPFADTNAPTIYFKQTASDGDHEFVNTVQNVTMTTSTSTLEIENLPGALRTLTLTDANYTNLPIESATLTLN